MARLKILSYLPHHVHNYGIGYAMHSIAINMNNENIQSDVFSIHSDLVTTAPEHVFQFIRSRFLLRFLLKFISIRTIIRFTEKAFLKRARLYDVIYLWPGFSIGTIQSLKSQGKIIVLENINCHQQTAKYLLDNEEKKVGITKTHSITDDSIKDEELKHQLADYIFSPSKLVTQSLVDNGVDRKRIIDSSYGLSENELLPITQQDRNNGQPVFLFVGSVILRKGVHLLLDYWVEAKLDAKLKIVGKVDQTIEPLLRPYRNEPTIEFVPFCNDLTALYQTSDVFVLPSIEEGSPLVTYLAIGAGLPCITSPMGGDGVIRDSIDGFIIPLTDKKSWVEKLSLLATDAKLREKLGSTAHEQAKNFLWKEVAEERREKLLSKLGI